MCMILCGYSECWGCDCGGRCVIGCVRRVADCDRIGFCQGLIRGRGVPVLLRVSLFMCFGVDL